MPKGDGMRRASLVILSCLTASCTGWDRRAGEMFNPIGNPNSPDAQSEVARRVRGEVASTTPILPEEGDIWPGQPEPVPSLQDVSRSNSQFINKWHQLRPQLEADLKHQLADGQGLAVGEDVGKRYGSGKAIMPAETPLPSHVQDNADAYLEPVDQKKAEQSAKALLAESHVDSVPLPDIKPQPQPQPRPQPQPQAQEVVQKEATSSPAPQAHVAPPPPAALIVVPPLPATRQATVQPEHKETMAKLERMPAAPVVAPIASQKAPSSVAPVIVPPAPVHAPIKEEAKKMPPVTAQASRYSEDVAAVFAAGGGALPLHEYGSRHEKTPAKTTPYSAPIASAVPNTVPPKTERVEASPQQWNDFGEEATKASTVSRRHDNVKASVVEPLVPGAVSIPNGDGTYTFIRPDGTIKVVSEIRGGAFKKATTHHSDKSLSLTEEYAKPRYVRPTQQLENNRYDWEGDVIKLSERVGEEDTMTVRRKGGYHKGTSYRGHSVVKHGHSRHHASRHRYNDLDAFGDR